MTIHHLPKFIVIGLLIFTTGFVAGRYSIPLNPLAPYVDVASRIGESSTKPRVFSDSGESSDSDVAQPAREQMPGTTASNERQNNFTDLLRNGAYREAMLAFDHSADKIGLHNDLIQYLEYLLTHAQGSQFIGLTEIYLNEYFDDIDVLLLLSRYNLNSDYFYEAINTLYLASSYAVKNNYKIKVTKSVEETFATIDTVFSAEQRWYELTELYQTADGYGLLSLPLQTRLLEIYLATGAWDAAIAYAATLEYDPQAAARIESIFDQYQTQDAPSTAAYASPDYETLVALEKRGNHFIVPTIISDAPASLILDTGASITTITMDYFNEVSSQINAEFVESKLFSTANGLNRGDLYRVDQFRIGDQSFYNVLVAVLEYPGNRYAVGLLGMNILKKFRFRIDQDSATLHLSRRD